MKLNRFPLIFCSILCCSFALQLGCEEERSRLEVLDPDWFNQPVWQQIRASAASNTTVPPQEQPPEVYETPQIQFNASSHDFGRISPNSLHTCEFVFTNTGNSDLVISKVETSCSNCTAALLENDKKVYAPGESGKLLANYTDTVLGQSLKHIYVYSNDPASPRAELAVHANLVAPIDYEPKRLNLSLISANGGCPEIVVRSIDGQPFSIKGFQSTYDCITADFNPQVKATQFVLRPKVDMARLRGYPEGSFRIDLSRADCEVVSGTYYTPPRFSASPQRIIVNQAIEPSVSRSGIVNVLGVQRTRTGYQLSVQVNPPEQTGQARMFSDNINISLNGVPMISIPCNGYYPGAQLPVQEEKAECKTCGAVRIDKPSMSYSPR
ncbi:MAG: DUF1573 domain-containing protein [Sedimentisphaerales bacterium]